MLVQDIIQPEVTPSFSLLVDCQSCVLSVTGGYCDIILENRLSFFVALAGSSIFERFDVRQQGKGSCLLAHEETYWKAFAVETDKLISNSVVGYRGSQLESHVRECLLSPVLSTITKRMSNSLCKDHPELLVTIWPRDTGEKKRLIENVKRNCIIIITYSFFY